MLLSRACIGVPPPTAGLSNAIPLAGSAYAGVYPFSTAATDLTYDIAADSPDNPFGPFPSPSTASSAAPAPLASTPSIAWMLLSASTTTARTTTLRTSTTATSTPRREDRQRCLSFVFHSSFSQRYSTPADVGSHAHRRFLLTFFTLLSNYIFPTIFILQNLHHHHTTFQIPRARRGRNFALHPNFISRPTNLRKPGEILLHLHDSSSPTCLFIPHVKTAGECQSIISSRSTVITSGTDSAMTHH